MTAPEPVYVKHLSDDRVVSVGLGTDWSALASAWLTSWERAALRRAHDSFDGSARAVNERLRNAVWQKVFADGVE